MSTNEIVYACGSITGYSCGKIYKRVPLGPADTGFESTGMCESCSEKFHSDMDAAESRVDEVVADFAKARRAFHAAYALPTHRPRRRSRLTPLGWFFVAWAAMWVVVGIMWATK